MSFSHWAGKDWKGTNKQIEALKVEARRIGIPVPIERPRRRREEGLRSRREEVADAETWRFEWVEVKGSPQMRYRDLKTGRFIKKPF